MYYYRLYEINLFSQKEEEVWCSNAIYSSREEAKAAAEKDVDEEESRPFLEDYITYSYEIFAA